MWTIIKWRQRGELGGHEKVLWNVTLNVIFYFEGNLSKAKQKVQSS